MAAETRPAPAPAPLAVRVRRGSRNANLQTYAREAMSAGGRAQIHRNRIFRRVKLYGDRHDQVYEPEGDRSREMDAEQEFSDRAVVNLRWRNVVPGERINGEQIDLVFAGPERV